MTTYTRTVVIRDGPDMGVHTVTRFNDRYVCDKCGLVGPEHWAQLPHPT